MSSTRAAIVDATHRLTNAGVPTPGVDAELLLAHVLGLSRGNLILSRDLTEEQHRSYNDLVEQRCRRKPLQHLTGDAGFRRLVLTVGPGVFVPRPETETLVELAVRHLRAQPTPHVAYDLCAGSGAIALSVASEVPSTDMTAVEFSDAALPWLRRNVDKHSDALQLADSRVNVRHDDATMVHGAGDAQLVTCNPPYIPDAATPQEPEVAHYDPPMALYGGPDGLDLVRALRPVFAQLLASGGLLLVEHADVQGDAADVGVPSLLREHVTSMGLPVWRDVTDYRDLNGRPRVTAAYRSEWSM